jgi:nucleoside-diphosphate-sugar epimerase
VSAREIAETIGRRLNLPAISISPEQAPGHFGPLAGFAPLDITGSSAKTRKELGWEPSGPGLLADLENLELA